MSDYYCPNCGADLGDQIGFDPDSSHWTCTECGQLLIDPDVDTSGNQYENVGWFCDRCGAYLNDQLGFSDWQSSWRCTECGYVNRISDDDIYSSEDEYQRSKDVFSDDVYSWEWDDNSDNDENDYDDEDEDDVDIYDDEENDDEGWYDREEGRDVSTMPDVKRKKRLSWKTRFEILLGLIVIAFVGFKLIEYKSLLPIPVSSVDCVGRDYEELVTQLKKTGYLFISGTSLSDLDYSQREDDKKVESVTISKKTSFEKGDKISRYAFISVRYHSVAYKSVPFSAKDIKKGNYDEALKQLQELGFGNIAAEPMGDLITGWVNKEGAIESVTIDGDNKFSENASFRLDAEIIIKYHSFEK